MLEKTLESPLDCKEIQPVHPKGDQSWVFIGKTDAEADQYFGHFMRRADSFEKTLMLGGIEGRRRRGQDEMVGWHHRLNGHESEQAPGDGSGQGSLACCSPWVAKSRTRLSDGTAAPYPGGLPSVICGAPNRKATPKRRMDVYTQLTRSAAKQN